MIWDLKTVYAVERLYSEAHVDPMFVQHHVGIPEASELMSVLRRRLADYIIDAAHPYAAEPHPDDIQIRLLGQDASYREGYRYRAWWRPQTLQVELRGGQSDGQVFGLPRMLLRRPIVVPVEYTVPLSFDRDAPIIELEPSRQTVTYDFAGFNETERRWVYDVQG